MAFNIGQCKGAAGPGAPFPQWSVISSAAEGGTTGVVGKVTNPLERRLVEITAFPSRVYFFTSQAAAQQCIAASGGAVSPPLQQIASGGQAVTNTATGAATSGLDWLKYIADFFHRLTEPQTWVRIAEFAVGGMLVYVGVRAALAPNLPEAGKAARKTGSIAGGVVKKTYQSVTPTGRATRVITKHKARVKASDTRQRAQVIRGKRREFTRKELYP